MTAVVCAAFDEAADAEIRRRIDALARAGLRVRPPLHRPHITLGAADVPVNDLDSVVAPTATAAREWGPFRLVLSHLGIFPGGGVLWLAPAPSAPLAALHAAVDDALTRAGHERAFGDRSGPASWVAHCTLATRLDPPALARAVEAAARSWRPVPARVESLLVIQVGRSGEQLIPLAPPPSRPAG